MTAHYQDLGNGIYCIDTVLYRPQNGGLLFDSAR